LASKRPNIVPAIAIPVALAFICRPLAVTIVIITTVYIALYHRRQLVWFLLLGTSIALLWMAYNWRVWGTLIPAYYIPGTAGQLPQQSWFDRLFGPLISPSRGLLVFSPVFILSAIGPLLKLRRGTLDRFDGVCLALVSTHVFLNMFQPSWFGGHSTGSRYMTDIVPELVYLMLPALQLIEIRKQRCPSVAVLFILLLSGISLLTNTWVTFSYAPAMWNVTPINIDSLDARSRLWNWTDLPFLRGTELQRWNHPLLRLLEAEHARQRHAHNTHIDLRFDEGVNFVTNENWSDPESWGRWTTARRATLSLKLNEPHNLAFYSVVRGLVWSGASRQSIWIEVNGCRIGTVEVQLNDPLPYHVISGIVPTSCLHPDGQLVIAINTDHVWAPSDIGLNSDKRQLGVGVISIRIRPI
jgi:hypothetical protein